MKHLNRIWNIPETKRFSTSKLKNMILEYLQSNDKITSAKIQEMCGFTKQQARTVIDKMRNEELLDICRRGKKSYYVKL